MRFEIYVKGLACMSVCVSKGISHEELERIANRKNPTGIDSRWRVSDAKNFAYGEPNPCQCEWCDDFQHVLFEL